MTTSLAFFREHTSPDVEHLYQQDISDASVGTLLTGRDLHRGETDALRAGDLHHAGRNS
jgi:hypothetical protein